MMAELSISKKHKKLFELFQFSYLYELRSDEVNNGQVPYYLWYYQPVVSTFSIIPLSKESLNILLYCIINPLSLF